MNPQQIKRRAFFITYIKSENVTIKDFCSKYHINESTFYEITKGKRIITDVFLLSLTEKLGIHFDEDKAYEEHVENLVVATLEAIIKKDAKKKKELQDVLEKERCNIHFSSAFYLEPFINVLFVKSKELCTDELRILDDYYKYELFDRKIAFVYIIKLMFLLVSYKDFETMNYYLEDLMERYGLLDISSSILGMYYYQYGRVKEIYHQYFVAYELFEKAKLYFKDAYLKERVMQVEIQQANLKCHIRDYKGAISDYQRIIEQAEQEQYRDRIAPCVINRAEIYFYLSDYVKCMDTIKTAKNYGVSSEKFLYMKALIYLEANDWQNFNGLYSSSKKRNISKNIRLLLDLVNAIFKDKKEKYEALFLKNKDILLSEDDRELLYSILRILMNRYFNTNCFEFFYKQYIEIF